MAQAWGAVRLTEARQVAGLMGVDPDDRPPADVPVQTHYDALRAGNLRSAALQYLGHALPRLEAIAWAARVVADNAAANPSPPRVRHALDVALRWLDEPTEAHRRAAGEAADAISQPAAERLLASAVFFSGGSIVAANASPVVPPDHVAARYAVGAIDEATRRTADRDAALESALALGERIAEQGMAALDR
ncbi:hypothetical protein C8J45_10112 [Sphingomonas sp. PP-CE-3G-477]|jgi:hypothetical protein|uniref:DUF6931 family protein n=1 Tax=Sphingomonas sp. PP-CE-3G-477 TaxID=2135660 RepID=UPI000D394A0F|nr:hypothetical protein [Sphingomonas sp. PP-CE-3G-477]PTQ65165.1 hypothetical protein C8J45_10112 [Sphingomonas sp. PP-CE-3G-477]